MQLTRMLFLLVHNDYDVYANSWYTPHESYPNLDRVYLLNHFGVVLGL